MVEDNLHLDYDHMTVNIRGFTDPKCNKNFRILKHIPIVTHNIAKYDSHSFLRELVPNNGIFDSSGSLI